MFDKFKQLGDLMKMKGEMERIQKQLASEEIEYEESGIKVVMTGDQKIKSIEIDGEFQGKLVDVLNKTIRRTQEVAAKKLSEVSGGLGGLLG